MLPKSPMKRSAALSPCGLYRTHLRRIWDPAGTRVCFIGLNPSTADGTQDDPTLRRCIVFAKQWGHGSLVLLNLFARRTPSPAELWRMAAAGQDIEGQQMQALIQEAAQAQQVVACWGAAKAARPRGRELVLNLESAGVEVHAIQRTKGGDPSHPLYLRKGLTPLLYSLD
ncbi:MAG: hypothetical protein ACI9VR_003846 [Cognaticolwellia sp.]|jgi:hypothetical protein